MTTDRPRTSARQADVPPGSVPPPSGWGTPTGWGPAAPSARPGAVTAVAAFAFTLAAVVVLSGAAVIVSLMNADQSWALPLGLVIAAAASLLVVGGVALLQRRDGRRPIRTGAVLVLAAMLSVVAALAALDTDGWMAVVAGLAVFWLPLAVLTLVFVGRGEVRRWLVRR